MHPMLVNGAADAVIADGDQVLSLVAFTVANRKIVASDVLADPSRLTRIAIPDQR
jgi:hypothetical protein